MTPIPESTAAEQRAHEPSMEEILASIRKIISEDVALPITPRLPPREAVSEPRPFVPPARPESDFSLSPPPPATPRIPRVEPSFSTPTRAPETLRPLPPARPVPAPITPDLVDRDEGLISDETGSAVAAAFQTLSAARPAMPGPEVMEAMARELLRPMLKEWLDDNLPTIVERLVRAEIERVARGPR
jgi:cell pole-organizing protein PopZ